MLDIGPRSSSCPAVLMAMVGQLPKCRVIPTGIGARIGARTGRQ